MYRLSRCTVLASQTPESARAYYATLRRFYLAIMLQPIENFRAGKPRYPGTDRGVRYHEWREDRNWLITLDHQDEGLSRTGLLSILRTLRVDCGEPDELREWALRLERGVRKPSVPYLRLVRGGLANHDFGGADGTEGDMLCLRNHRLARHQRPPEMPLLRTTNSPARSNR